MQLQQAINQLLEINHEINVFNQTMAIDIENEPQGAGNSANDNAAYQHDLKEAFDNVLTSLTLATPSELKQLPNIDSQLTEIYQASDFYLADMPLAKLLDEPLPAKPSLAEYKQQHLTKIQNDIEDDAENGDYQTCHLKNNEVLTITIDDIDLYYQIFLQINDVNAYTGQFKIKVATDAHRFNLKELLAAPEIKSIDKLELDNHELILTVQVNAKGQLKNLVNFYRQMYDYHQTLQNQLINQGDVYIEL